MTGAINCVGDKAQRTWSLGPHVLPLPFESCTQMLHLTSNLFSVIITLTLRLTGVGCRVQTKLRLKLMTFYKYFEIQNLNYHILIQHEKCIQISTNKLSISSVDLRPPSKF